MKGQTVQQVLVLVELSYHVPKGRDNQAIFYQFLKCLETSNKFFK